MTADLFTGIVITSNAGSRAVTVVREISGPMHTADSGKLVQATVLSSVLSHFLGFKDCVLPQPGTRVLCLSEANNNCYVLGSVPQPTLGKPKLSSRAALGAGDPMGDAANRKGHVDRLPAIHDGRRPVDVVDGEYVVGNELGVLIGLYQEMANLKASELAQIQCYLLDDLVRIISHNFQHYSALGEYNIYHDGKKIMAEFGATHKPAESYGAPAVSSDSGAFNTFSSDGGHEIDDSSDFYKITKDERIKAIERFKIFLGSVGDFLHMFLVKPHNEKFRLLDPEQSISDGDFDTGLCDLHLGTDGGVHLRSVKEVFIEKTNWIRVPLRKSAPDDPKGDDASSLDYDQKEKFEFVDDFSYKSNPFTYALQIRDYVAYVNEKLGYQNFKSHEKDFGVSNDVDAEQNISKESQIDAETQLYLQNYKLRTAGIYLMPNGGITIRDAWNSAIVMEGGSIYIQPAKDLISQPLRNNITKAGGSINISCKKHIDISSTEEGFRLKTEKSQYYYSDNGGYVVETNGSADTPGTPDPKKEAIDDVGGIVFKSKLSIYNYAEKDILNYAKNNFLLKSLNNVDMYAVSNFSIYGSSSLHAFSDGMLLSMAQTVLTLAEGGAIMAGAGSTVLGQKDQNLGVMYDDESPFIDVIKGVLDTSKILADLQKAKENKEKILERTTFQKEAKFDDLKFKFLKSYKYNLSPQEDAIPMSIAQQDDLLSGAYGLSEWEEKEINETLPYPGKELFENFYYSAEKPVNLEKKSVSEDYTNKPEPEKKPAKVTLESLMTYKVQS
jgi:hypothetical protein